MSEVTICSACGTSQPGGSAFCAVCGTRRGPCGCRTGAGP